MTIHHQYPKMTRREFLRTAGSCLVFDQIAPYTKAISSPFSVKNPSTQPNVIFIMADDLGYGDLGCYGQEQIQTPYLDQMAAEGMRFTQCYSSSPVCAPTRWSLLTGWHTGHAHAITNSAVLRQDDVAITELLKSAGYTTGVIGKWALGDPDTAGLPNDHGFDYWYGYLNQRHAHNYYPQFLWHNRKMDWYAENLECQRNTYSHDVLTEEALAFIRNNQNVPFFLYLPYTIPHANNELGVLTGNGMQIPSDDPYTNQNWPQPEKNFAAMITRLDQDVGRILDLLQELNLDDNTAVFFTSDNGAHQEGGHLAAFFNSTGSLRAGKGFVYEAGIRVPMLVRWPNTVSPGQVSDQVWALWDVLATVADIAGVNAPIITDGISILPVLQNMPGPDHDYLYWAFQDSNDVVQQAVRISDWKGVRPNQDSEIELYDLQQDVGETMNIAAQHPDIVLEMAHIMNAFHGVPHQLYLPVINNGSISR